MSEIRQISCTHARQLPLCVRNLIVNIEGEHIEDFSFYGCKRLTTIIISPSVTSVGESAFNGCTSLTSITLSPSVTSIRFAAFSGCISLTSIVIPPSVKHINAWAFNECTSLTSIVIPPSVTAIGPHAFGSCTGLRSVIWHSRVSPFEYLDGNVFNECENLRELLTDHPVGNNTLINYHPDIRISKITDKTLVRALQSQYFSRGGMYTIAQRDFISTWLLICVSLVPIPIELSYLILRQLKFIDMGVSL